MSLQERFEAVVGHGWALDVDIAETDGNYLVSSDGERYVDLVGGWNVVNVGYGRDEIVDAMHTAASKAAHVKPTYRNEAVVELAETLAEISPGNLSTSFRFTSGTEAVENAIKAARVHTGRTEILANEDSYHGMAFGAMSLGTVGEPYEPLLPGVSKITPPSAMDHDDWLAMFEQTLDNNDIAAYVTETLLTHQGVHRLPKNHYTKVKEICDEHGTLLVLDEVANGFGRTGHLFAADYHDAEPDIMTLAKGFSSGYAPIAATVVTDDIADTFADAGGTYSTFGWTPEAVAAAQTNIELIRQENLPQQARETGALLAEQVEEIDGVEDVRQYGLLLGLEFAADVASDVRAAGAEHNVLTGTAQVDNVLVLSPPLNIDEEYVEDGVEKLEKAILDVV